MQAVGPDVAHLDDGLPVDGPFDLLHARDNAAAAPRSEEVFARLAGALAAAAGWSAASAPTVRPRAWPEIG